MIKKSIADYTSKYFDDYYFLPSLYEKDLEKVINDFVQDNLERLDVATESKERFKSEYLKDREIASRIFKDHLRSIRKIKKFKKKFEENVNNVEMEIALIDIIVLTIIEINDLEVFNIIRSYYNELSIMPYNTYSGDPYNYKPIDKLISKTKKIMHEILESDSDLEMFYFLFPHIKDILELDQSLKYELKKIQDHKDGPGLHKELESQYTQITTNLYKEFKDKYNKYYHSVENKRGFAHFIYITKYFIPDRIDKTDDEVTNRKIWDELKRNLKECNPIIDAETSEIIQKLQVLFPQGKEKRYLREYSFNQILEIICKYEEDIVAENLLIIFSKFCIYLDDDLGIGFKEKIQAPFYLWEYLSRRPYAKKEIMLKIIEHKSNSDIFANSIIFKIIKERTNAIRVDDNQKAEIVRKYIERVERKLDMGSTIFDEIIFDDKLQTIWRWHDALFYCMERGIQLQNKYQISDYLVEQISTNVDYFECLFDMFIDTSYGIDQAYFKHDDAIVLLNKENVIEVIKKYLISDNKKRYEFKKIEVLKVWYDEEMKKDLSNEDPNE